MKTIKQITEERNAAIAHDFIVLCDRQKVIAKKYGLSESRVKAIIAEWRKCQK